MDTGPDGGGRGQRTLEELVFELPGLDGVDGSTGGASVRTVGAAVVTAAAAGEAGVLRSAVMAGKLPVIALKARMLCDALHLQAGMLAAFLAQHRGAMKSKSLAGELFFSLYPTTNMRAAFQDFGLADSDTTLVVLSLDNTPETEARLAGMLSGEWQPLSALPALADGAAIRKLYKVEEAELQHGTLSDAVVMRMAVKSVNKW